MGYKLTNNDISSFRTIYTAEVLDRWEFDDQTDRKAAKEFLLAYPFAMEKTVGEGLLVEHPAPGVKFKITGGQIKTSTPTDVTWLPEEYFWENTEFTGPIHFKLISAHKCRFSTPAAETHLMTFFAVHRRSELVDCQITNASIFTEYLIGNNFRGHEGVVIRDCQLDRITFFGQTPFVPQMELRDSLIVALKERALVFAGVTEWRNVHPMWVTTIHARNSDRSVVNVTHDGGKTEVHIGERTIQVPSDMKINGQMMKFIRLFHPE